MQEVRRRLEVGDYGLQQSVIEVREDWNPGPPKMCCNHHHHFYEHPRGTGEAKGEHSELKVFLAHVNRK